MGLLLNEMASPTLFYPIKQYLIPFIGTTVSKRIKKGI